MSTMITNQKDTPKNKTVLLFSGGMDSLIMNHLLQPDILLVCCHGNKYQDIEFAKIQELTNRRIIPDCIFETSLQLGKFERDDAMIPCRNLYFILLAAQYGETIYLGSVYGDRSLDKSSEFFLKSKEMLDYLYLEQHWCVERKFQVAAPFKEYTKTELVREYLSKGGKAEYLLISYSCYEGHIKPCGWCKPCFRKWVALQNNGILTNAYFLNNPRQAPWLPELLPLIQQGIYRGREDNEILLALDMK